MKGWYISKPNCRLRYGDNRKISAGCTHEMKWPYEYEGVTFTRPTICEAGLHASKKLLNALNIAFDCFADRNDFYLWRVEVTGRLDKATNKFCGDERTYLWGIPVRGLLKIWKRPNPIVYSEFCRKARDYLAKEIRSRGLVKKGEHI